jgi:hypothetical protein
MTGERHPFWRPRRREQQEVAVPVVRAIGAVVMTKTQELIQKNLIEDDKAFIEAVDHVLERVVNRKRERPPEDPAVVSHVAGSEHVPPYGLSQEDAELYVKVDEAIVAREETDEHVLKF